MSKTFYYDKENDILAIHKGFDKDESFKTNIDAGDLILDVSSKEKIRGIEILNATDFLKEFDVTELKDLVDADFTAQLKPTSIVLTISLKIGEKEIPAKIAVPLPIRQLA